MIERQFAMEVQRLGLKAIEILVEVLNLDKGQCTPEEYERIRRGVGISIGNIQTRLLDVLYEDHPDIDNLK